MMMQLVTGGGKTIVFVQIIKDFLAIGKRVVLIAHREELITQAWDTLHRHGIIAGIIKSGIQPNYSLPCQVGSIQTICRRQKMPHADLVVIDEAHHSQDDNSYGNALADHWPRARVLGVTATPYRLGGAGFGDLYESLIQGPAMATLQEEGHLCYLRYFISYNPDLSKAKIKGGDYVIDDAAKAMRLAPLVQSYQEHCTGMSGICFAVNIEHSNQIVAQYLNAGIPAAHVDANTPTEVRRKLFADLKAKRLLVLVNVGIATEGTDIPTIDFVQLARPTKSLALFLQMIGRVTRPSPGKECGYVLDNAGLYIEHGLPDTPIDWQQHFKGRSKKDKKAIDEQIEILEFVAEDEDGRRVVSRTPAEVEGLKLIEINHVAREKIINMSSLREFDKLHGIYQNIKAMQAPGYNAFRDYKKLCIKNSFLMSAEVWAYLRKRLCVEPTQEIEHLHREQEARELLTRRTHSHIEAEEIITASRHHHRARVQKVMAKSVAGSFLDKERDAYIATLKPHETDARI